MVSHGFIIDITKTDAENKERLHALIDDVEGPGERLATLFEPEVLPPRLAQVVTKEIRMEMAAVMTKACEPYLGT